MDPLGTILVAVLMVSGIKSGVAQEGEFREVSSCMYPGCELVVECTITGGGATVWQGTIFDGCQNKKITLRHSQFTSGRVINESCGIRGPIVGRSVSAADGSFTSQLTVTFSEDLSGKTIECANESGQIVGSKQIDLDIPSALPTSINISFTPPMTITDLVDVTSLYNVLTTTDSNEWEAERNWSTVFLPLASTGILLILLVLTIIFVVTIMKYKSRTQHKTFQNAFTTRSPSDHSDNPVGSHIMMDLGLGQYSLLHHPSNEEGMMTYLEIGPSIRDGMEVIPSADRVEYAEVNTQSQNSVFKNDVDKYLNLDTLLIQIRCQVTPLWHEFGVAAGVPMDTLNKCLNYTPEESIVEVLDYWLRQSKRTWGDVARVLNEISLQELAEKMLKIYDTGLLPTTVVDEDNIMIPAITSGISNNSESVSEKSQTPPPLPLKP